MEWSWKDVRGMEYLWRKKFNTFLLTSMPSTPGYPNSKRKRPPICAQSPIISNRAQKIYLNEPRKVDEQGFIWMWKSRFDLRELCPLLFCFAILKDATDERNKGVIFPAMAENEKIATSSTTEKPKINKLGLVPVFMDIGNSHFRPRVMEDFY